MSEPKKRTLTPVNVKTGERATPVDVTGRSERNVERVLMGMLRNIHEDWYVEDSDAGED